MCMILKRDGRKVPFDKNKISIAICAAYKNSKNNQLSVSEYKHIADNIATEINSIALTNDILTVERVQDLVEEKLMNEDKYVAKQYIIYRNDRSRIRENNSPLMRTINEKINASNVQNQNANIDEHSFGGRAGEARNEVLKSFALSNYISDMARKNHEDNLIYIHDLDSYAIGMHNCLSIPFDDLLAKGFNTRQTDVRPAASINTAFQLLAVIFQLQSLQQFGGVSATHLDWTMVPYVKKSFFKHYIMAILKDSNEFIDLDLIELLFDTYEDEIGIIRDKFDDWLDNNKADIISRYNIKEEEITLSNKNNLNKKYAQCALLDTINETRQAVEGMYHNLNTLQSRSGNQLPFTSINYGTCTSIEGRIVIKALLDGCIKGVGAVHKTAVFPCGIFQLAKGINRKPEDPNYDMYQLAIKSTVKRLYPNYANVDWSGNAGYDPNDPTTIFSTMGCRTANGWDINGLGQQKDGRGNICPVTIILPSLAMIAVHATETEEESVAYFMGLLENKIHEAKDMLIERFEHICSQPASSAKFMYENNLMAGYDGKDTRSALKHGTLAIGQLGMAEALQILIGCDHTEEKGMELAKKIEQVFKDRCLQFKEQYKLNFGVYYTPAENLCYTAMKKFKNKYGDVPNVTDHKFFTNSIHVPVWKEIDPFEKIDIESQLTGYSSAGCITYVELDTAALANTEAVETIINYAMDHDIPYFAINVPNDTCLDCGFTGEFNDQCPICNSTNIQQLRRVTGYLTGDYRSAFNLGKQEEVQLRYQHSKKMRMINIKER